MKLATIVSYLVAKLPRRILSGLMPLQGAMHRLFPFMKSKQMTEFTIPSGILKGKKFLLTYDEAKRYWHGGFEPRLLEAFSEYISPGMTVYDVGANLGFHSLAFSFLVGEKGKVLSFEPNPSTIERLKGNVSLNIAVNNVEVVPYSVLDRAGLIEFKVSDLHHSQSRVAELTPLANGVEFSNTLHVPALTLDAFVFERSQPAPSAVKIDIEGAEHLAIAGMRNILTQYRPMLFVELHTGQTAEIVLKALRGFDYSLKRLNPEKADAKTLNDFRWSGEKYHVIALPA